MIDFNNSRWFMDYVNEPNDCERINNVLNIKQYLTRHHKVAQRKDITFKNQTYKTAKTVLNTLKSIINFHTSYVCGNPVSISGNDIAVSELNKVYKKGLYSKIDYQIANDLYKYGNAYEYVYSDNGVVKSHIIANEDAYPVYDENLNYICFVEYWNDAVENHKHYTVYYNNRVEVYSDNELVSTNSNLTGLPIHYASIDKQDDNCYGDSILNDLIPIMDEIELLLSKMNDSIYTLSMNPIGVCAGTLMKDAMIDSNYAGAMMNMDDGSTFDWKTATLDEASIKLLLDNLLQQLYNVGGVPSAIMGQSNIANVSEVSLKMMYSQTDNIAKGTEQSLREGMYTRFVYIRKLLALNGITLPDEDFDSLDIVFNVNRPIDTSNLLNELKTQRDMSAISIKSVVENSPYTKDVSLEMERLNDEKDGSGVKNEGT